MSEINQRTIQSISTGPQPSEPLPKDAIIGPTAGSPGIQYIQRHRCLYRWPNRQERSLDRIKLYQGTITPLPSQIRFYRNRARRVIAIFENGHDIEPPLLEDSQIPYATIVTTQEFLCNILSVSAPSPSALPQESSFDFQEQPPCRGALVSLPHTSSATDDSNVARGESTIGEKRRREIDDDETGGVSKRPKSAAFASPVITFVLGVAVGAFHSNIISRICENYT